MLTNFVREVTEHAEGYPPILRSRMESARDTAEIVLRSADAGIDSDEREELSRILSSTQLWERGLLRLEPLMVWELSESNIAAWQELGRPGQIWIRWDALTLEERGTAVSLASFLRDLQGGRRRGGRPAGATLTAAEKAALALLGPDWQLMSWQDGWRHMTTHRAWAPDGRSDLDRKARRARATRWARLKDRFAGGQPRKNGDP